MLCRAARLLRSPTATVQTRPCAVAAAVLNDPLVGAPHARQARSLIVRVTPVSRTAHRGCDNVGAAKPTLRATGLERRRQAAGAALAHVSSIKVRNGAAAKAAGAGGAQKAEDVAKAAAPSVVDGMPRYPSLTSPGGWLRGMDYFGTAVFAVSGSVMAGSVGMDLLGGIIVGTITAVGGGTIRDAIILHKRPFWSDGETEYLYISVIAAAAAFLAWPTLAADYGARDDGPAMQWGDAVGVGAFCVIGAQNALRLARAPLVVVGCGMVTATFGGLTRDVLARRPGRILHSHTDIYATTALGGASAYVLARAAGAGLGGRIAAGVLSAMALRWAAWTYDVRLATWAVSDQSVAAAGAPAAAAVPESSQVRLPL